MPFENYLAIFLGGGLGSLCRWAISQLSWYYFHPFPIKTLLANLLSSFILGGVSGYFASQNFGHTPWWQFFLAAGFCGGFSTFSTFSLETFTLLENQQYGLAFAYVLTSCVVCVLACGLSFYLFK
ncbi:MAG: fluoride efflux transporter CrcB [Chitinophagales bacterium]|nr:fluoride efflux transporter CrcB [Bacteroidota bacterium]MCB9042979.1 fluoride efflux transporter CrcB [Chitinophagales bacterium]